MQNLPIVDLLHYSYLPQLPVCPVHGEQDAYNHTGLASHFSDSAYSPLASPSCSDSTPPSSPSPSSSQSRKRKVKKSKAQIPRPPNAFILFRSDFWAREKQKIKPIERNHRDFSRIAGHCWKNLDANSKQQYYELALQRREMHRQQFPDYKLKPAAKRPRVAKKDLPSEHDVRCANLASSMMPELLSETWVNAREAWEATADPLHCSLVPTPTMDIPWDDPFGLSITDIDAVGPSYGASGWGIQEQYHPWVSDDLTMGHKSPILDGEMGISPFLLPTLS